MKGRQSSMQAFRVRCVQMRRRVATVVVLALGVLGLLASSAFAYGSLYLTNATSTTTHALDAFTLGSFTPATPIVVGNLPDAVALTPNGSEAYVGNEGSDSVSVISTATGTVTNTISSVPANGIAVSPDGSFAFAVGDNTLTPINTATDVAEMPITVGSDDDTFGVALSPDGQTAYTVDFATTGSVSVVSGVETASPTVTKVTTGVPGYPFAVAVTPDGSKVFVVGIHGASVLIPGQTHATPLTGLTGDYYAVAISSDGTKAYFLNQASSGGAVQVLDIATGTVTALATGDLGSVNESTLIVSPDGSTLYAALGDGESTVVLNAATGATIKTLNAGQADYGAALTPDQAPVAELAATPSLADSATALSATGTTTADGGPASYAWNFGDGSPAATTSTSGTTHVYAAAGTYTARVTATDDQGCSTAFIFTGQTASCNGGPSATKTVTVVVPLLLPVISSLSQSHAKWRESNAVPRISRKRKPPIGTTFFFGLNTPASVSFVFSHSLTGREVAGSCVVPTRKNHKNHRCSRTVTFAPLIVAGDADVTTVSFAGRLSAAEKLPAGSYTLTATASVSGNISTSRKLHFIIVHG
jgi:YVTN family beta-propeller protein